MREGSGGGEVTGINWITPRWLVTHGEASRREAPAPCNGEAHAGERERRLKTTRSGEGPPVSEPSRERREPVRYRPIGDERWRSSDLNDAAAKG